VKCPAGHESAATDYCDICGEVMPSGAGMPPASGSGMPSGLGMPSGAGGGDEARGGADAGGHGGGGDGGSGIPGAVADSTGGGADVPCPNCGAPNPPQALFCENCGYDHTTGTMPRRPEAPASAETMAPSEESSAAEQPAQDSGQPASAAGSALDLNADPPELVNNRPIGGLLTGLPDASDPPAHAASASALPTTPDSAASPGPTAAPASAAASVAQGEAPTGNLAPALAKPWVAEVWIDPQWYALQNSPDPLPSPGLPTVVALRHTSILVGRHSASRGITPDIDCGADNGVSRRHAQLTSDGTRWWVEDLASSNGTFIGEAAEPPPSTPIPVGVKREVGPDARLYLGSWTRIVLRLSVEGEF